MSVTPPLARPVRSRYRAYGVELACDFELPQAPPSVPGDGPTIRVEAASPEALEADWTGLFTLHEAVTADGGRLRVQRGAGGDHLIRCGPHSFRLWSDRGRMVCAPPSGRDPGWEQAFLDWAAYAAAVLAKTECLHAGAVEVGGRVLAVAAPSGGGKSTVVASLVAAGARFFGDDVLAVERRGERVVAHPGAPFARLDRGRAELAAALGTVRAEVGGELWVQVEEPAAFAAPLALLTILDRRPDGPATPRFRRAGFAALRSLSIGFPGAGGGEARRLAILSGVAAQAEVLHLEADLGVPPAALAAAILARAEGAT